MQLGSDSAGFGWDGFCRKWCDFGHAVIYSEDVAEIAPLAFGIGLTGFGSREDFGTNRCFSILREYQQLLSARNPREQSVLLYGLRRVGEGAIVCLAPSPARLEENLWVIPAWYI